MEVVDDEEEKQEEKQEEKALPAFCPPVPSPAAVPPVAPAATVPPPAVASRRVRKKRKTTWVVESILDSRGTQLGVDLEFKIRWEGDPSTWGPGYEQDSKEEWVAAERLDLNGELVRSFMEHQALFMS